MIKYDSISALVELAETSGKKISEICLKDQAKEMDKSEEEVFETMEKSFDVMVESKKYGQAEDLRSVSGLTGGEGAAMEKYVTSGSSLLGSYAGRAAAYALSVADCNAAMGRVVAAPTAGSCGILPGCLLPLYEDDPSRKKDIVMSLFTAGAFGMVIANRACIAGAEGGCQAECGSASGMAAASLVELMGGSPQKCADALGMALTNQLGLVCDPVAGLVEIPCIKRNVSGVTIAISSADMALSGIKLYIPADECIQAMRSVGNKMSEELKETAQGGLAATPTAVKMMNQFLKER